MTIPSEDLKIWLTNPTGTSDGSGAQNNPDDSRGGWRSTTEESDAVGNLIEYYSQSELDNSDRFRVLAITNTSATGVRLAAKLIAESFALLKPGLTVTFGLQTNDKTTPAPTCTDTTPPANITFFAPYESTGDDDLDYAQPTARPLGPLNADSDGVTILDFDNNIVIFLYIKISASGASGIFEDVTDNTITPRIIGTDTI